MTEKVRLAAVSKRYGGVTALAQTELSVAEGEFVTLLGPSGSGKTTLLNLIAGMASPSTGSIHIDGVDVTRLPASRRGLGMVFQHYALMPHMNVFENIAFPLRVRRVSEPEIRRRVAEVLETVQLPDVAKRRPAELSGGQQQRISIARCIVYNPAIILMDEPLGALDKKLREEMQLELKQLHTRLGITVLYVTHDQEEALSMSDRIVLLNGGHIEQSGAPSELYFQPRTLFAADFLGSSNLMDGTVLDVTDRVSVRTALGDLQALSPKVQAQAGERVKLMVRPENVALQAAEREQGDGSEGNRLDGRMIDHIILGGVVKSYVALADGSTMVVQELTNARREPIASGSRVAVRWPMEDTLVLPAPP